MTAPLPEWLQPLVNFSRPFPKEAVETAIARREETIPHLLHALESLGEETSSTYMLHMYALYLLAQFRETRAFPLVIRLFRKPGLRDYTGDGMSESLGRILAATCGGNIEPIKELIEDSDLAEWDRSAGITALGVLMNAGELSREALSEYFGSLFAGKLEPKPCFAWESLAAVCADFGMSEHLPAIRDAYARGLCSPEVDLLEDLEIEIMLPPGKSERVDWTNYSLIEDTVAEMSWWHCFEEPSSRDLDPIDVFDAPPAPLRRESPKIGRNDPCPCASGKKYKKCCGVAA